jgi:hypothetical protein
MKKREMKRRREAVFKSYLEGNAASCMGGKTLTSHDNLREQYKHWKPLALS